MKQVLLALAGLYLVVSGLIAFVVTILVLMGLMVVPSLLNIWLWFLIPLAADVVIGLLRKGTKSFDRWYGKYDYTYEQRARKW